MREIVKVWTQGQAKSRCIIIPKLMAEAMNLNAGDFVELILDHDILKIRKI